MPPMSPPIPSLDVSCGQIYGDLSQKNASFGVFHGKKKRQRSQFLSPGISLGYIPKVADSYGHDERHEARQQRCHHFKMTEGLRDSVQRRFRDIWKPQKWGGLREMLPSGKLSHNYGKSPFFMGKSTINHNFQ